MSKLNLRKYTTFLIPTITLLPRVLMFKIFFSSYKILTAYANLLFKKKKNYFY
jgi:hypothetical protein